MPSFRDFSKFPKWIWIVGIFGVFLMLFGSFGSTAITDKQIRGAPAPAQANPGNPEVDNFMSYEETYNKQLETMLNQLPGVSDAQVMVTIDSTADVIYAQNLQSTKQTTNESDKTGVQRTVTQSNQNGQLVIVHQNGNDVPVVEKKVMPKIRGVLVEAKGAESARVQEEIKNAIQGALDIPIYKISVLPKK
ncbi:stage III sporulation protein AG [Fodinisporobacter ferrooxydans]|uniref:Stage III sporulation protein AG n=1 Tax=Fodinisporobacter ferrooxydans TaxID=2901836 RepID=A0ABY4CHW4_9BACL|nr:stage III sporulation protein AG [Alicyclobacillaceae bacterium MYW30-H2]